MRYRHNDIKNDDWDEFEDNFSDQEIEEKEERKTTQQTVRHHDAEYDKMNEIDLLIEYGLLCCIKCEKYSIGKQEDSNEDITKIWDGMDKLLKTVSIILKKKLKIKRQI